MGKSAKSDLGGVEDVWSGIVLHYNYVSPLGKYIFFDAVIFATNSGTSVKDSKSLVLRLLLDLASYY